MLKAYRRLLNGALNHRLAVVVISFWSLIAMAMIWFYEVGLEKPIEFFPDIDPNAIYINLDMPEGADLEYSDRIARQVEVALCMGSGRNWPHPMPTRPTAITAKARGRSRHCEMAQQVTGLTDMPNVKHIYSRTVAVMGGQSSFEDNSPNHIGIQFHDMEDRIEPSPQTVEEIRNRIKDIPGAEISIAKQEEGPPTGAPINIEISGDNFDVLGRIASRCGRAGEDPLCPGYPR